MPSFFFVNNGQSIQAAIDAASAGDTILVGTGVFNESLNINKALSIISLDGAGTTIINGQSPTYGFSGAVKITASGVNFGDTNHGFTVNAGPNENAAILLGAVANVHIEGNTIVGNATGAANNLTQDLLGGGNTNLLIENNVFSGTADQLVYINGEVNTSLANDSHNVQLLNNQFSGTAVNDGALVVLDADTSGVTGNTFNGTGGAALVLQQSGNTVSGTNSFAGFGTGTDIVTTDSFDLSTVPTAENLTLADAAADTQTFDNMALGAITDGENGWKVAGSHDQEIVDRGGGNHAFRMSSDPSSGDFGGPYSPNLAVAAGEAATSADYTGQSISFDFSAVHPLPDGSRLEIDFGNVAGTDRNNFLVIESFAATGIRIAASEPNLAGDFSGDNSSPAPNDWRQLISHVDPTQSHHLELRLNYVDGPNNDVIQVYLDGTLIGTTTTFENYHDSLGGTHLANAEANLTDRVFFRGGANGSPQDGPGGAADAGFYIDNLTTAVYNDTNGTGNTLDNIINGNSGNNTLSGLGGNDTLDGNGGDDTLTGGAGDDTIEGAAGFDVANYSGNQADYTGSFDGTTVTLTDDRVGSPDGTDTITSVGRVNFADHDILLVTPGGDFSTIQSAIDAANPGDTIVIGPGTYHENITINKAGLTLTGAADGVVIAGTFRSDNAITGSTAAFFTTATSYSTASGNGVTITADNVRLQNLTVSGFNTDIELGDGVDHTHIENVILSDAVNGLRKATAADLTDLNIMGGKITEVYLGMNFAKSATAGDGLISGMTVNGTTFEHITQKGIYTETLSHGLFTNITMTDVGQYGGGPAFGANGTNGNGIDLNLKYELGVYNDITIQDFNFTNVGLSNGLGSSHANAAAIAVKARDDAPTYAPTPADFTGSVIIQNGTINGTSTGIRAGEAGKNIADPAVDITDVTIINAVHSATHGDVANVTQSVMTVIMTNTAETLVASPTSTGSLVIDAEGGSDNITAGNGNDTIEGCAGDDVLDGLGGVDTALYVGTITAADVTVIADADPVTAGAQAGWQVNATANGDGTDQLEDIEIIDNAGANILLVGNGGFTTIQAAIDAAANGDTILIANGSYIGDVTLKSGITLIGESEAGVIVDGTMLTPTTLSGTTVSKMSVHNVGDTMLLDMRGTTDITDTVFDHVTFSLSGDFSGAVPMGNGQVSGTITLHDGADADSAGLTFQNTTMLSNNHIAGSTAFVFTLIKSDNGAKLLLDNLTLSGTASGTPSGLGAQWNMSPQTNAEHAAVEIKNSHTSGGGNFYVSGFDSVSIHDNVFDGQGVALNGDTNATVTGNTFQNISNTFTANGTHHRGLMIEDAFGTDGVSHVTVTGNTFSNITALDGAISFQRFTDGSPADTATIDRLNDVLVSGNTFSSLGGGVNPVFLNSTYFGAGAVLPSDFHAAQLTIGTSGPNTITDVSTGDMAVFAGPGDDTVHGGAANDAISAGTGSDTATYTGTLSAASFSYDSANHRWVVNSGAEGTDFLTGVEIVTDGSGHRFRLVDGSGGSGYAHIQDAVDAALAGDFILVAPGTYTESGDDHAGHVVGLYINTANLTLHGYSSLDGSLVTIASEAKLHGPTVVSGHQTGFGANHWIDLGGDGVTIQGLHLQAGVETNNKLLEIWADNVTVKNNFIDVNEGGTNYTFAVAVYINDNGTTSSEISAYIIDHNILNEGIIVSNGVGDPPGVGANQLITNNSFEGTFNPGTGVGRYDTVVVNGEVPGIGWLLAPTEFPTVSGNTFANNTTPFLFRGSDADETNFPTAAQVAAILAANGDNNLSYAYALEPNGHLRVADRNDGNGPYHSFAVTNTLDTLNLALDNTPDNVFGGQRAYILSGDTVVVQSGDIGTISSAVMVDNLTIKASQHSTDLNLTLATTFADGSAIAGGVMQVTLADYATGLGANVDVTGNGLGNTITGNSGNNNLFGFGSDDTLRGNGGNDFIDGGANGDTVIYSGTRASYQVDDIGGGQIRVIDLRGATPDGTDTIQNVENFTFSDGTFTAAAVLNDPPNGGVTVTGTPTEDQTLTANTAALADADGLGALHYQWKRNGTTNVGSDQSTYAPGDNDVGQSISVVVSYTDGHGTAEAVTSGSVGPIGNVNDTPTGGVTVTGTATEDQVLTANTATLADADSLGTLHYQWKRGATNVGSDQSTYTLGDNDAGQSISVVVSYTDGHGTAESVTSGSVGPVANINDALTGGVTVTGTTTEDQVLTANSTTLADADGLGTLHYQWKRGATNVGSDQSTYTLGDNDVGQSISVVVSYTDQHGTAESVTSGSVGPVANVNDAPTGGVSITGTAAEDQTLTANTAALADNDGLGALHYQWKRGATNVGSDQATYLLGDNDVGQPISVVVSYTDGHSTAESVTSGSVGPIANVNDAPVAQNAVNIGNRNTPMIGTATATDVDNTQAQLAFSLVGANGGAAHGTVTLAANGGYTYTPAVNYTGPDIFQFHANDGSANSNTATISVTISNSGGPVLQPPLNDFNDDGKGDILWQNNNGTPAVWLMDGTTPTQEAQIANPGSTWHVKGSGDFDGDGKSEILWQNDSGAPSIWTMNGTTMTSSALLANPGSTWHIQETADFNGDGKSDIIWQNDNGAPSIWLMDGTTVNSATQLSNPGSDWHVKAAADFNADGKADILWQNDDGTPSIWLMDGTTVNSATQLSNPGPTWHAKAAADFNADGKADILWQNDNGTPSIWLMDGTTMISAAQFANPGSTWHALEAFDMNADGKADIQWQNDNGTPSIWLMDGTNVTSAAVLANPTPEWHLI